MADGGVSERQNFSSGSDPFANFSFEPPRSVGPLRSLTRRSRYKAISGLKTSRDQLGSNTSLSSLSGSSQNLLDPVKLMSMQEDAKSRRISAEVMKHSLYASVISSSPYHRRQSMYHGDYRRGRPPSMHGDMNVDNAATPVMSRFVQSLPVSPAQSHDTTPAHSPTALRQFRMFLSHTTTPRNMTPDGLDDGSSTTLDVEEDSWKGLASLFKPRPRYIPATPTAAMSESLDESMELSFDSSPPLTLSNPPKGHQYRQSPDSP
jgi:hypothetical protein